MCARAHTKITGVRARWHARTRNACPITDSRDSPSLGRQQQRPLIGPPRTTGCLRFAALLRFSLSVNETISRTRGSSCLLRRSPSRLSLIVARSPSIATRWSLVPRRLQFCEDRADYTYLGMVPLWKLVVFVVAAVGYVSRCSELAPRSRASENSESRISRTKDRRIWTTSMVLCNHFSR